MGKWPREMTWVTGCALDNLPFDLPKLTELYYEDLCTSVYVKDTSLFLN